MREIKFRAWCIATKKMFKVTIIHLDRHNDRKSDLYNYVYSHKEDGSPNCILMQFTGLTDKNGVEIYEGDIIYFQHNEPWYDLTAQIVWNCFSFMLKGMYLNYCRDEGTVEVIGNIYENPELLKKCE